jgi:hypothetical protein
MNVTRNVIIDLLPLYIADEASEDSRALVREYLEGDPELAEMAEEAARTELPADAPAPVTWEDKMKAYKEAKRMMLIRTVVLAVIISASALTLIALGLVGAAFFVR